MLWLRSHRWYRDRLSAHLDGELTGKDALRLGAHLESCGACAEALAEFRAASTLLADLPDLNVPRSFALTAADVARTGDAGAAGFAHSANSGLRMAGAGLAAALAVVLVLDAGGIVGGGSQNASPAGVANPLQNLESQSDQERAMRDFYLGQAEGTVLPTIGPAQTSSSGNAGSGVSGPASGGGVGGTDSAGTPSPRSGGVPALDSAGSESPTPTVEPPHSGGVGGAGVGGPAAVPTETPLFTPSPATARADGSPAPPPTQANEGLYGLDLTASPSPAGKAAAEVMPNGAAEDDKSTLANRITTTDSNDGPSAVLLTEIVLAALLGMSIAGIAAATYAERRRR